MAKVGGEERIVDGAGFHLLEIGPGRQRGGKLGQMAKGDGAYDAVQSVTACE